MRRGDKSAGAFCWWTNILNMPLYLKNWGRGQAQMCRRCGLSAAEAVNHTCCQKCASAGDCSQDAVETQTIIRQFLCCCCCFFLLSNFPSLNDASCIPCCIIFFFFNSFCSSAHNFHFLWKVLKQLLVAFNNM